MPQDGTGEAGWWMASDGNLYPPEQHPDHRSPVDGDPDGPAAAARRVGRNKVIAIVAGIVLVVVVLAAATGGGGSSGDVVGGAGPAPSSCTDAMMGCFSATIRSVSVEDPNTLKVGVTVTNYSQSGTLNETPVCSGRFNRDADGYYGMSGEFTEEIPPIPQGQSWTGVLTVGDVSGGGGATGATVANSQIDC